ncbi:TPA: SGNH/GDSL hydrolase family protein [Streptococcus suis]
MNNRKIIQALVFFFLSLLLSIFLANLVIPKASSKLTAEDSTKVKQPSLYYLALGDSLTEGVGDTTGQGGFATLLANSFTNEFGYQVTYQNFGISGNTSSQIYKRMKEDSDLAEALKDADVMTLTVGGNDLRKVILKNITNLDISTFDKPATEYGKRLEQIIRRARENNPNLPIYVIGIYNPFYLNFPELTDMQLVVDKWNQETESRTRKFSGVYFVPINDLLYKGLEGEQGISVNTSKIANNLLYGEDSFHPNNTGYEIIKQAVMEKIRATKEEWKNK